MTQPAGRTQLRPAVSPEARIRAGLDVLEVVLDEVVESGASAGDRAADFRLASKIAGEAGMLLRMGDRALVADHASRARIRDLATRLAPYARASHVVRDLVRRPSHAPMRATAHACLSSLGVTDDAFDRLVRLAFASSVAEANERVPYRMLDAAWGRHLILGDAELNHPATALSPIGVGVDLLAPTTEDVYAFTHALVYATDFGRLPLPARYDTEMLAATCDALCIKALDDDDLDLLGELLMAPACLRTPWSPVQVFAWRVLIRAWDEHGFVPGPGLPEPAADESEDATVRRVLGTAYHTMFVSSICVATLVSADAMPPDEMPPGVPGRTASALPTTGTACVAAWRELDGRDRAQLGELAIGLTLRRAMERDELNLAGEALAQATQAGLAERPLFVQTIEYLERALAIGQGSARPAQ
jgi:hypothetical protein